MEFCKRDLYQVTSKKRAEAICNRLAEVISYKLKTNGSNYNQVRYFDLDEAMAYYMKPLDPDKTRYKENRDRNLNILNKLKEDIVE